MTPNEEKGSSRSDRKKENLEQSRLRARGYLECAACGKLTKPSLKRCAKCGRMMPRARNSLAFKLVAVAVIVILVSILFMPSGSEQPIASPYVLAFSPTSTSASSSSPIMITFSKYMDQASVQSAFSITPSVGGQFQWTGMKLVFSPEASLSPGTTYQVKIGAGAKDLSNRGLDSSTFGWFFTTEGSSGMLRSLGNGVDTFWTSYPMGHPQSGSVVAHPQWVLDALQNGPVMILDHSTNCQPCIVQTGICEKVSNSLAGDLTYFDLVSGQDEPMASTAFAAYDPTGGIHYIPLTILVTKALDSYGNTVVAWHSWEGVVYEEMLRSWISDAQTHYGTSG